MIALLEFRDEIHPESNKAVSKVSSDLSVLRLVSKTSSLICIDVVRNGFFFDCKNHLKATSLSMKK